MVKQIGHFMEKGARGEGIYVFSGLYFYSCMTYINLTRCTIDTYKDSFIDFTNRKLHVYIYFTD